MKLKVAVSHEMGENCYFVIDENTNDAIVIDPGDEADKLCRIVDREQLNVMAICLTHCHFDHAGAAERLKKHTNAPIFICRGEEIVAESTSYNLSAMFGKPFTVPYDKVLDEGDSFKFGSLEFKVILTPGHTPGGGCFYFENEGVLFSGDTLFYMSVGRTDFPGGDSNALLASIKDKLLKLPENTIVYPGHGAITIIREEKEVYEEKKDCE